MCVLRNKFNSFSFPSCLVALFKISQTNGLLNEMHPYVHQQQHFYIPMYSDIVTSIPIGSVV